MNARPRSTLLKAGAAVLVALVLVIAMAGVAYRVLVYENWSDSALEQTRMAAQPVVDAIEAYKADTARLPASLADLVPAYIAEIPDAPAGSGSFSYGRSKSDPAVYFLHVDSRHAGSIMGTIVMMVVGYPDGYYYDMQRGRWVLDDS